MKLELLSTEPTYLNMDHYYTNRKQYVMEKVDEIRVQVQISGVLLYLVVVAIDSLFILALQMQLFLNFNCILPFIAVVWTDHNAITCLHAHVPLEAEATRRCVDMRARILLS